MSDLVFTKHPILKGPTDEEIVALTSTKDGQQALLEWHRSHEQALLSAQEDPLNFGFKLESWENADKSLENHATTMICGGNRCLAGEQLIFDEEDQELKRVDEIDRDFFVRSFDLQQGKEVLQTASRPFRKPHQPLFQLQLSDGSSVSCSPNHQILCGGQWRRAIELNDDVYPDALLSRQDFSDFCSLPLFDGYRLLSIVDTDPLMSPSGVLRLIQTILNYQSNCSVYYRQCDGQLREVPSIVQGASPSPDDVLECISYVSSCLDGLECKLQHSRIYLLCDRPSTLDDLRRLWDLSSDILSDASYKLCKSASLSHEDQGFCSVYQQSTVGSFHLAQSIRGFDQRGIRFYYVSSSGGNRTYSIPLVKSHYLRNDTVWDFEVKGTHNYFIGNCLNHNSSKTNYSARCVIKAALSNPNAEIICFAQDSDASVRIQQRTVYEYLPPDLKKRSKSTVEYLNYTHKNGFTGASFILPNGSQVMFHTYSQFIANRGKFEGLELGSKEPKWHNVGIWCDEYLEDGDLVETMMFRLATRDAKLLISFTPIDGYTPFVADYLKNSKTIQTRPAELLGGEEVPVVQVNAEKDAGIVYFHSDQNPFGGYDRIKKELQYSSRDKILTRAYGIPVKSMTTLFPLFNTDVHVVSELPEIREETHTVYMACDPAGARNYAALWAAVDGKGRVTILREWPDRETHGEWAVFGDPKWKHGPAAKKLGLNLEGYAEEFKRIEDDLGVKVFERIGDSRFFASENEDNTDLFAAFAEHGMDFVPSDGRKEEVGLTALDDWFSYNPNVAVDEANMPICRIHESCGNLIYSLINYGANGKIDEPLKDFVDLMRYLRMANGGDGLEHYGKDAFKQNKVTWGY